MMMISFAAVIAAAALVAMAAVMIPAILEIRKAAIVVRECVAHLDSELQPTIKELQQVLVEVRTLTEVASAEADELRSFMTAVGDTGRGLRTISTVVGGLTNALASSSLWLTGAKVAGKFVMEKFVKKRR
jgi:uncharacterized protein YoxC